MFVVALARQFFIGKQNLEIEPQCALMEELEERDNCFALVYNIFRAIICGIETWMYYCDRALWVSKDQLINTLVMSSLFVNQDDQDILFNDACMCVYVSYSTVSIRVVNKLLYLSRDKCLRRSKIHLTLRINKTIITLNIAKCKNNWKKRYCINRTNNNKTIC